MDKYKELISRILATLEEAAKLTGNTWDDLACSAARTVFERLFARPMMAGYEGEVVHSEVTAMQGSLPAWLVPLVLELATQLLRILKKES